MAELVSRYCLLGVDCAILEVQNLAWFIDRGVKRLRVSDPLKIEFQAYEYGAYSRELKRILESVDGSCLCCDRRLVEAGNLDLIWFNEDKRDQLKEHIRSDECKEYFDVIEWASATIDGFETPLGLELLATVDWMMQREKMEHSVEGMPAGLKNWASGGEAVQRKVKNFDKRLVEITLNRLIDANRSFV